MRGGCHEEESGRRKTTVENDGGVVVGKEVRFGSGTSSRLSSCNMTSYERKGCVVVLDDREDMGVKPAVACLDGAYDVRKL